MFTFGVISNNVIQNNYIGVDATGVRDLGNSSYGIQLWNDDSTQVIDNVVSGNGLYGIFARNGSQTNNAVIQGNRIGVGADGTTMVANSVDGIRIQSDVATNIRIGGTGAGEGNVIAGNNGSGIRLNGASVAGTIIEGNAIGTDVTGSLNLGNLDYGILVENNAAGTRIGVWALLRRTSLPIVVEMVSELTAQPATEPRSWAIASTITANWDRSGKRWSH